MAAVGGDDVVFFGQSMFNAGGDGFLARGKVAEAADQLFFVEAVGGHFHASVEGLDSSLGGIEEGMEIVQGYG